MRAVEDADRASARAGEVSAPVIIVRQLLLARLPERGDRNANRPGLIEHVPDGAVFAGCIDTLQHDEQRALAFGIEPILQLVDDGAILPTLLLRSLLVRKDRTVGRIALGKLYALTALDPKPCRKIFGHSHCS